MNSSLSKKVRFSYPSLIGASLENRFDSIFPMDSYSSKQKKVALAGLSNLLAGISYFYGSTVQYNEDGSTYTTPKGELITAIPGRSYFPRGFLWDEGFHQLVLLQWNETLSWKILKSWFNRMEPSVSVQNRGFECRATSSESRSWEARLEPECQASSWFKTPTLRTHPRCCSLSSSW